MKSLAVARSPQTGSLSFMRFLLQFLRLLLCRYINFENPRLVGRACSMDVKFDWPSYYKGRDIFIEYKRKMKRHKVFFDALSQLVPEPKTLELGVGYGVCLAILHEEYGLDVAGIDSSKEMLEMAKFSLSKISPSLEKQLKHGSATSIPFAPHSFDIVYSQGLLEHYNDTVINLIIEEGLRVAKYFCFSVPTCYFKDDSHLFGDERLLSKEQWDLLLSDYKIITSEYYASKEEYYVIISD